MITDSACPSPRQPGTLRQQLQACSHFVDDPLRFVDRQFAWELARREIIPHANRDRDRFRRQMHARIWRACR